MSDDGVWRDPIAQAALDKSHGKIINPAMDYGNSSMPSYHGNTSTSSVQGNYQSTSSYSNYASSNQYTNSYGYYGSGYYGGYDSGHGGAVIGWGIILVVIGAISDQKIFLVLSALLVGGYFGLKILIWAFKIIFSLKGIVAIVIGLVFYLMVTKESSFSQPSLVTSSKQGQQIDDKDSLITWLEYQTNSVSSKLKGILKTDKVNSSQIKTDAVERSPKFTEYSAGNIFKGNRAEIVLASDNDKLYRTRLLAASNSAINFAGEYVFQTWGCNNFRCETGAIVSARTGNVYHLPFQVCCWEGEAKKDFRTLDFRSNSRLFVAAGLINGTGTHGAHFYEFTGTEFKYIKTIPVLRK